jgi:hypothetical protein
MFLLDRGQVILVGGGEDGSVSALLHDARLLLHHVFQLESFTVALRLQCGMFPVTEPSELKMPLWKFSRVQPRLGTESFLV